MNHSFEHDIKKLSIALFVYLIASTVCVMIFAFILYASGYQENEVTIISNVLGMSAVTIFILQHYTKKLKISIPYQHPNIPIGSMIRYGIVALGLFWGSSLLFQLIASFFDGFLIFNTPDFTPNHSLLANLFDIGYSVILAPIFEELIFRGFFLSKLKQYGPKFAIVTVSLLFALLHGNLPQTIPTFFLSIGLCILTLKSNSIYPAILTHFIGNGIGILSLLEINALDIALSTISVIIILLACIFILRYIKIQGIKKTTEQYRPIEFFSNWASISYLIICVLNIILFIQLT